MEATWSTHHCSVLVLLEQDLLRSTLFLMQCKCDVRTKTFICSLSFRVEAQDFWLHYAQVALPRKAVSDPEYSAGRVTDTPVF